MTEANLETLRADLAFLGVDAIDETGAVYNQSRGCTTTKMAAPPRGP